MSVDRPRTGAAATRLDSRVAAAAIGSPIARVAITRSPATRFDSRAAAAISPGPGIGRTLIGYQPAGASPGATTAAFRAATIGLRAATPAHDAEDSARTTEWEPHEIELTLDVLDPLDEFDPFDPSATIELSPAELAALAAAAAAHDAASATSSATAPATTTPGASAPAAARSSAIAAPTAVATRSRRLATSPRSAAAAALALPPSARPAYRCPPRPPRPGLFIGCLAASALLILLYALYVFWALAQASAHGT